MATGLYTTGEIAAYFRVKPVDVVRMVAEDGLPAVMLPGKKRPIRKFSGLALYRWVVGRWTGTSLDLEDFLRELEIARNEVAATAGKRRAAK